MRLADALRMMAPSIFASSYSRYGENAWSSRIPPENRNDSSAGSPITIRAPSLPRRMSLMPWRMVVPGEIRRSASISLGSWRGSDTSSFTERLLDRLLQRDGGAHGDPRNRDGTRWSESDG